MLQQGDLRTCLHSSKDDSEESFRLVADLQGTGWSTCTSPLPSESPCSMWWGCKCPKLPSRSALLCEGCSVQLGMFSHALLPLCKMLRAEDDADLVCDVAGLCMMVSGFPCKSRQVTAVWAYVRARERVGVHITAQAVASNGGCNPWHHASGGAFIRHIIRHDSAAHMTIIHVGARRHALSTFTLETEYMSTTCYVQGRIPAPAAVRELDLVNAVWPAEEPSQPEVHFLPIDHSFSLPSFLPHWPSPSRLYMLHKEYCH